VKNVIPAVSAKEYEAKGGFENELDGLKKIQDATVIWEELIERREHRLAETRALVDVKLALHRLQQEISLTRGKEVG
jgi:hypothetical protein